MEAVPRFSSSWWVPRRPSTTSRSVQSVQWGKWPNRNARDARGPMFGIFPSNRMKMIISCARAGASLRLPLRNVGQSRVPYLTNLTPVVGGLPTTTTYWQNVALVWGLHCSKQKQKTPQKVASAHFCGTHAQHLNLGGSNHRMRCALVPLNNGGHPATTSVVVRGVAKRRRQEVTII